MIYIGFDDNENDDTPSQIDSLVFGSNLIAQWSFIAYKLILLWFNYHKQAACSLPNNLLLALGAFFIGPRSQSIKRRSCNSLHTYKL